LTYPPATHTPPDSLPGGLAFFHGWCIDEDGAVYDPQWRNYGAAYFGIEFTREYLTNRFNFFLKREQETGQPMIRFFAQMTLTNRWLICTEPLLWSWLPPIVRTMPPTIRLADRVKSSRLQVIGLCSSPPTNARTASVCIRSGVNTSAFVPINGNDTGKPALSRPRTRSDRPDCVRPWRRRKHLLVGPYFEHPDVTGQPQLRLVLVGDPHVVGLPGDPSQKHDGRRLRQLDACRGCTVPPGLVQFEPVHGIWV
jgi:hypothetical protein